MVVKLATPAAPLLSDGKSAPEAATLDATAIATTWTRNFTSTLLTANQELLERCFVDDCYLRDILVLSRDYRTIQGSHKVAKTLLEWLSTLSPTDFKLAPGCMTSSIVPGLTMVRGTVLFNTSITHGAAIFSLVPNPDGEWKAWTVVTRSDGLIGYSDKFAPGPVQLLKAPTASTSTAQKPIVEDKVYPVVILGGGQCGLATAARLESLGVQTIVIERNKRAGDNWRLRYDALNINTPKAFNHLPFVPYPSAWPHFPASGQVADFMEDYVHTLGLTLWTSTNLLGTTFDAESSIWTVQLRYIDGSEGSIRARHFILATGIGQLGLGSKPVIPAVPGTAEFGGKIMHSTEFVNATPWVGKKVVVIGTGCSAHDLAQASHNAGASSVTMIQRSETTVVSRDLFLAIMSQLYKDPANGGLPTEVSDRIALSIPPAITRIAQQASVTRMAEIDVALLDGLRKAGFALPERQDDFIERLLIRRGGYYLNCGASDLIVAGKIKVKALVPIVSFTQEGILFEDATEIPADLVIFGTGFGSCNLREVTEEALGPKIASQVNVFDGWDEEGEIGGLWRPSGHKNLWLAGGDWFLARFYSRMLALQIKATEEGLY